MTDDVSKLPAFSTDRYEFSSDPGLVIGELVKDRDAYRARMEALLEYACHAPSCGVGGTVGGKINGCDCGLDALGAACEREGGGAMSDYTKLLSKLDRYAVLIVDHAITDKSGTMNDAAEAIRSQADTITALRAEVERLHDVAEHWRGQFTYQKSEWTAAAMLIDTLRSQLSARDAEVRALRGFANDLLGHRLSGEEWLLDVMCEHLLLDADYKPTPLLTGEPGPGGEG
jgi:hypothetical protein